MHLGVFLALPLYLSILSGAWLKRPAVIFLPLFSFLALIGKLFWRERHGQAAVKAEKMPPPECLWHSRLHKIWFLSRQIQISAATNPDFWGNKSWRLREKSGLMLMQGAAGAPVQSKDDPRKMTRAPFPKDSHTSNSCRPSSFYRFEANSHALKSWKRSLNLPIHISFWNKPDLHQANCIFRGCFHHLECNTSMFDWARIAHKDFPGNDSCHELGPGF